MEELQKELALLRTFMTEGKLEAIDRVLPNRTRHLTVVLEDICQMQNASAVIRSCDCFGVQDLHVIENKNRFNISKEIVRGSSKWVDIYRYRKEESNTLQCLETLKKDGYKIVVTSPHQDDFPIEKLPLDQKVALVIGSEGFGISDEVVEHADYFTRVPMFGFTESLNLSVTAAICIQQLTSRLHASEIDWKLSAKENLELNIKWFKQILQSHTIYDTQYDR